MIGHTGESPAHIAIYKNDEEMLKTLIAGGADPNFKNSVDLMSIMRSQNQV